MIGNSSIAEELNGGESEYCEVCNSVECQCRAPLECPTCGQFDTDRRHVETCGDNL